MMQASPFDNPLVSDLGIALFCIIGVCGVGFLISLQSGWFYLGRRFKRQSDPYGETKSAGPFLYTVYMRWWSKYSSVIRLTAASDALYVSILFPLRIGHPPLRIPWDEIGFGRTKFFFRTYIVLTLGSEEKIPMRISLRMARNLGILDRCPA
ncbi:MAG: hypothetical protein ABSA85_07730 [Terracidiphilus sp.]|jgi:hypothetical protein